ncbi:hypothetical protein SAMN05421854_102251 [Amycolatopsis rubida]|uniref:Uncharacterized protein n=1 Tax=Amycolatopsis rubida TaxID=112413 RepID=A0A1I5I3V0_9PSEU|nr:hypothetical protein SAMN05421854_102251 [Amycolatopsis rubida]
MATGRRACRRTAQSRPFLNSRVAARAYPAPHLATHPGTGSARLAERRIARRRHAPAHPASIPARAPRTKPHPSTNMRAPHQQTHLSTDMGRAPPQQRIPSAAMACPSPSDASQRGQRALRRTTHRAAGMHVPTPGDTSQPRHARPHCAMQPSAGSAPFADQCTAPQAPLPAPGNTSGTGSAPFAKQHLTPQARTPHTQRAATAQATRLRRSAHHPAETHSATRDSTSNAPSPKRASPRRHALSDPRRHRRTRPSPSTRLSRSTRGRHGATRASRRPAASGPPS